MNKQRKMVEMITWSAHLVPEKNAIRLYRRTEDLSQVRSPEPTNKRTIEHGFKSIHRDEIFEAAAKVLEENGYATINKWKRDQNFDIWYARVVEVSEKADDDENTVIDPIEEVII